MLLEFQRGDRTRPRGHALAYYRDARKPGDLYATYLIVPPIAIDLAKYMPPMLSGHMPLSEMPALSAVPLPPVPEKAASLEHLEQLAEARDDGLLFLGTMDSSQLQTVLTQVTEAAQEYLRAWTERMEKMPAPEPERAALGETASSVQEVMYGLMSDRDKLTELAKLVGKLRYGVEGRDKAVIGEAEAEMRALAAHLSGKYRVAELTAAGKQPGEKGRKLAELHLARCYKLCDEDYLAAERIDGEIRALEAQG